MSRSGQATYKGINAQSWAAMSLFLQYLRDANFQQIELEAPGFEDFNLLFGDGRRVVCESKAWDRAFSYSQLKTVLRTILSRRTLGEHDEILIICTRINQVMKSSVENMRYWNKLLAPNFQKRKFTPQQIAVLGKVKFWITSQQDNHLVVYSLFSELLDFWLPQDELEARADSILIKRIYEGSATGATYTREEILGEISRIRKDASKYGGHFDDERVAIELQLDTVVEALKNNKSPIWSEATLKAISSKPSVVFFLLDKIASGKIDNLRDWDQIWQLHRIHRFSFRLFKIFQDNLHTDQNRAYILDFVKNHVSDVRGFYQDDFFELGAVEIVEKVIEADQRFVREGFEVVKRLVENHTNELFYLQASKDDSWEREKICKLLRYIYQHSDTSLQDSLVDFILTKFNLVEEGDSYSRTPRDVFLILQEWLAHAVESRLPRVTEVLAAQHDKFYHKLGARGRFDGWNVACVMSGWGNDYVVSDEHFVRDILNPALTGYYQTSEDKDSAWKLIEQSCISPAKTVSRKRPDFLNRSVLSIVLERYASDEAKTSDEAFRILEEFILSKKGLPHKAELIYQTLRDNERLGNEKKWKLIEITVRKYGIPVNVFVEDIAAGLASDGHRESRELIKNWLADERYYATPRFGLRIHETIRRFLDTDFEYAVELLQRFITSKFFANKQDSFETHNTATLLYEILKRDFGAAEKIWDTILHLRNLTRNQQILVTFGLFNQRGDGKSDDLCLLTSVYDQCVDPLLTSLRDDIERISKRFSFAGSRQALVQFAGRLANQKQIEKAIRIVRVFASDMDPFLPGQDPEDPRDESNEHKRILEGKEPGVIKSVRGWCCWVLMECAVSEGRGVLTELISLVEKLSKDKNWYVKHMVCSALSQLAQNRLAVLPENRNILFFHDDKATALGMARRVEQISLELLEDISRAPIDVQKALAKSIIHVFRSIRSLGEEDAWKCLTTILKLPHVAVAKAAPLFIYYAEFRERAFANWRFALPGLYDYLGPGNFRSGRFRKLLFEAMNSLEPDERSSFAGRFGQMITDLESSSEEGRRFFAVAYKYLSYLSRDFGHRLFRRIYEAIEEGIVKSYDLAKLYMLLSKCLRREREFYCQKLALAKGGEMYWWPWLRNGDILRLVYEKAGEKRFLSLLKIIVDFPNELEINIDTVIPILDGFPRSSKRVKRVVQRLFVRNPTKYYDLRNKWLKPRRSPSPASG